MFPDTFIRTQIGNQRTMNILSLIDNLKLRLRNRLGRKVLWVTRRKDLMLSRDTDLCVEGFPRSANTYGVLLIEKFASQPLKIAHHLHIPSQLTYAIKWNIPAILLIREPSQAIPSLILREGVSIRTAMEWYNSFHTELMPCKEKLVVWQFDELVNNPLDCLRKLNEDLGLWKLEDDLTSLKNEEIFKEIDRLDKETKGGQDLGLVNSRPNAQKGAAKKEVLDEIFQRQDYRIEMERAKELYQFFTA